MARYENAIDLTVNLPDELLQDVFGYLPLRDKLRLESVSHRFKRSILDMLERKPRPLELDTRNGTLNGYKIRVGSLLDALRSFAYKAKFNSIDIRLGSFGHVARAKINIILPILIDSENCLEKVISFKTDCGCSENILEMFTAKCPKLSILGLGYAVRSPKELGTALDNKALTELDLAIGHSDNDLLLLFQSLKPNTLQKLQIRFHGPTQFDPAKMVDELCTSAWAALQELKMNIHFGNVQLAAFFDSLALLPSLNKCEIDIIDQRNNQFLATMKSLFKSSINMTVRSFGCFFRGLPGCQIISQIQQVQTWVAQTLNSDLIVDFRPSPTHDRELDLNLSSNNVLFTENMHPNMCANAHCVDCHRFYPKVLHCLAETASGAGRIPFWMRDDLGDFQLDRCRIDRVVEHLKIYKWNFLPTEANVAQDLVTVTFQRRDYYYYQNLNMMVASGRCFSNSCIKCIDV